MFAKITRWFSCVAIPKRIDDKARSQPSTASHAEGYRNCKGTSTQLRSVEHVSKSDLASIFDSSDSGVLVLSTLAGPNEEWDHSGLHAVYRNSSICEILGLPSESKGSDVLAALEGLEQLLLNDILAHLARLSAAEPAGSVNIYLDARSYPPKPNGDVAPIRPTPVSSPFTTGPGYGASGEKEERPAWTRRWKNVIVEPAMFTEATFGRVLRKEPAVPNHGNQSRQLSILARSYGDIQIPAEAGGFPAVVVTFVREPTQEFVPGGLQPLSSRPHTLLGPAASVHGMPSGGKSFPYDITATVKEREVLISRSTAKGTTEVSIADSEIGAFEYFKSREGMVLSGMMSIVTAFNFDGSVVLYQNAMSIAYYGLRAPPKPAKATGAAEVGAIEKGSATGLLMELFSLEPAKLQRMLADVCGGGRVWKGLVQVPVSCKGAMPSLSCAKGAMSKTLSSSAVPARQQQFAGEFSPLLEVEQLKLQPQERPKRPFTQSMAVSPSSAAALPQPGEPSSPTLGPSVWALATAPEACWYDNYNSSNHLRKAASAAAPDGLSTLDGNAYHLLSSNVEAEALATSTWGLLVDTEQQPHQDPHADAEMFTRGASRDGGSCGGGTITRRRSSTSPLLAAHPPEHAAQPHCQDLTARRAPVNPVANCAGQCSKAGARTPVAVPTAGGKAIRSRLQSMSRSVLIHTSDLFQNNRPPETTQEDGPDGRNTGAPRAASVHARQDDGHLERGRSAPRRGVTHAELGSTGGVSRILAFASSLKNTPSAVQMALQQAVTSSMCSSQNNEPLGYGYSSGRETSLPSSALYDSRPSSPVNVRHARPQSYYPEITTAPIVCEENDAPLKPTQNAGPETLDRASPTLLMPPAFATRQQQRLLAVGKEGAGALVSSVSVIGGGASTITSMVASNTLSSSSVSTSAAKKPASSSAWQLQSSVHSVTRSLDPGLDPGVAGRAIAGATTTTCAPSTGATTIATAAGIAAATARPKRRAAGRHAMFCAAISMPVAASNSLPSGLDGDTLMHRPASERFGSMHGKASHCERQAPPAVPSQGLGPGPDYCWHEVSASQGVDPITGQQSIIMTQVDVTVKVEAERHLAFVTEAEHRLLEQVFPRHVLAYMAEEGGPRAAQGRDESGNDRTRPVWDINAIATTHAMVTLLFADIQGFTPVCKVIEPRVVMAFLNNLFTRFDQRLDEFGVYKVETIGDCYFVAGGVIHQDEYGMPAVRAREDQADPHHARNVFRFAQAMLEAAAQVTLPPTGEPVRMRIGIHSGPVVSGVVGQRMPRFCLFGDTVNTTSRMESTGVPGCIHASEDAWKLLRGEAWLPRGGIQVKGKGPMNTFLWAPPDGRSQAALALSARGQSKAWNRAISSGEARHDGSLPPVCATGILSSDSEASRLRHQAVVATAASSMPSCGGGTSSGGETLNPFYSAGGFAQVWPSMGATESCAGGRRSSLNKDRTEELVKLFLS